MFSSKTVKQQDLPETRQGAELSVSSLAIGIHVVSRGLCCLSSSNTGYIEAHPRTAIVSGTTSSCGCGARDCQADQHQGKVPGLNPALFRTHTRLHMHN